MTSKSNSPGPVQENIETIARLEQELLERRSLVERIGDAIGAFAGTMTFVVLHVTWFVAWFLINLKLIPGIPAFDPYPFIFLSMVVSLESVLLTTFVLMKQDLMSKRADQRAHLDLQINLLSEREATKNLQMLKRLCEHFGLEEEVADSELRELSQTTAVEALAEDLQKQLPET